MLSWKMGKYNNEIKPMFSVMSASEKSKFVQDLNNKDNKEDDVCAHDDKWAM